MSAHRKTILIAGLLLAGVAGAQGCSSDEDKPASSNPGNTGSFSCYQPTAACQIIAGSKCMAKVDNSASSRKTLRLSQLRITAPAILASKAIQTSVVAPGVLQRDPACGLGTLDTNGVFNWIVEFDTATKKLRTGGARPVENIADGYCFLKANIDGTDVAPIEVDINYDEATGAFSTKSIIPSITVPIFTKRDAANKPIMLPISNAEILDGKTDKEGNCIGRYRGEPGELDSECKTTTTDVTSDEGFQFTSGGELRGIITMEQADSVRVPDLGNQTLCVLLTSLKDTADDTKCPRGADGKLTAEVLAKANTASVAGGPNDAVKLGAFFAASAVKIKEGDCP